MEYVVVHEICHLREMNHSRRFWAMVAESVSDHRARRRELRVLEKVMHAQERREAMAWRDKGRLFDPLYGDVDIEKKSLGDFA